MKIGKPAAGPAAIDDAGSPGAARPADGVGADGAASRIVPPCGEAADDSAVEAVAARILAKHLKAFERLAK